MQIEFIIIICIINVLEFHKTVLCLHDFISIICELFYQSHDPSAHPSFQRSRTFEQSNVFFPSRSFTSLCTWQNHFDNATLSRTSGFSVFNLLTREFLKMIHVFLGGKSFYKKHHNELYYIYISDVFKDSLNIFILKNKLTASLPKIQRG